MYTSNSNQRANPFATASRQQTTRIANPGRNPFGLGMQRTAGQLAPQRPAQGYQSNTSMQAQMPTFQPPSIQPVPPPVYGMTPQNRPDLGMMLGNGTVQMPAGGAFLAKGGLTDRPADVPIGQVYGVDYSNPRFRNDVIDPATGQPRVITDPPAMQPQQTQPDYAAILRALGYAR